MNNIINQYAFLRTSREFPEDQKQLTVQINKMYLDIANSVNSKIIGTYPIGKTAISGENWYIDNVQYQGLRSIYQFTSIANINHGINFNSVQQITKCTGSYVDTSGNYFGIIFGTSNPITGQLSFYVNSTQIVLLNGGVPTLKNGTIILEWISVK